METRTKLVRPACIIVVAALMLCASCLGYQRWAANHQLSTDEKVADFAVLAETLQANYPYFELIERVAGLDWLGKLDDYYQRIRETNSDTQFISAVEEILAELGQRHTSLVDPGLYELLLESYSAKAEQYGLQRWVDVLTRPEVIARYERRSKRFKSVNQISVDTPSGLQLQILQPDQVAYVRVASFLPANIESDKGKIREFLQLVRSFPALVIDIRGNKGGSDLYWRENIVSPLLNEPLQYVSYSAISGDAYGRSFVNGVIKSASPLRPGLNYPPEVGTRLAYFIEDRLIIDPVDSVGFRGQIFLLIDARIFSSAASFAAFAQSTGWATLVGQTARGDGISSDAILLSLPNSGLLVRSPMAMGLNPDGSANDEQGTVPDMLLADGADALAAVLQYLQR